MIRYFLAHPRGFGVLGVALFVLPAVIEAYLLMPFPGSQDLEAMTIAYGLHMLVWPGRTTGLVLLLSPAAALVHRPTWRGGFGVALALLLSIGSWYFADVMASAEHMFLEPRAIRFASPSDNRVSLDHLVLGVTGNGAAKAYPIMFLGYHHKILDHVGNTPVLVTYCTMCRTGRVFDPVIDGKEQTFRLVGARHYNAILEDRETKSWWYQATGVAAAGKRSGMMLSDVPYEQMTLGAWIARHPQTLILQSEQAFQPEYQQLETYDRKPRVSGGDPWQPKSWIVGADIDGRAKAYAWSDLERAGVVNDHLGKSDVLLALEPDGFSYHFWDRNVGGRPLTFERTEALLRDVETRSRWNFAGECVEGPLSGAEMKPLPASQEYWRSWRTFHPRTARWPVK